MKSKLLIIMLVLLGTIFISCSTKSFVVTFDYTTYSELNYSIKTKERTYIDAPEKSDYNYEYVVGWYTSKDYIYKWDFSTDIVLQDITLYAKWAADNRIINIPEEKDLALDPILDSELKKSFDFFYETSSTSQLTYGLSRDRYSNSSLSSIASTGYSLCALVVGVKNSYITFDVGYERAFKTLSTVLSLSKINGFFYHFMSMSSGYGNSEISVIDTALFIMGALSAGEYFKGGVKELATQIYLAVDWNFYINKTTNKFYMGYDPKTNSFSGSWDRLAEQLIMYVLASGSTNHQNTKVYEVFSKTVKSHVGTYIGLDGVTKTLYQTYNGEIFLHQYSHAFINFKGIVDPLGIDYYDNAVKNIEAHIVYTKQFENIYKTYKGGVFGLTAGDSPFGYKAYGAKPAEGSPNHDGTISPYGSLASINFNYEKSMESIITMYNTPNVYQEKYGFISSYNLGKVNNSDTSIPGITTPWYSNDYIGIDKGSAMVMIENYKSNLFYILIMQNEYIQNGLFNLGFVKI